MEAATHEVNLVRFKTFELDLVTRELRRDGQRLKLHGHPIDVLAILLERPGQLVPREELRRKLWPKDTFVDFEQILNNSIGKLRDALGDQVDEPQFIETLPRLGYRFIAPVNAALPDDPPPTGEIAESSVVVLETGHPVQAQPVSEPKTSKRWSAWITVAAVGALLGGALWYFRRPWPPLRVTHYEQITLDYRKKIPVGTDGARLYLNLFFYLDAPAQVAASGGAVTLFPVALPRPFLMDVSSDGSNLLVTSEDDSRRRSLWSVQTAGGTSRRLLSLDDAPIASASWLPDGKLVAYCTSYGKIYVMRSDGTDSHKVADAPGRPGEYAGSIRWSPDGSRIRFTWNHKLWEVSSSGSGLHPLLPDWHASEWQCCGRWAPDGKFFVFLLIEPMVTNTASTIPAGRIWAIDERRAFFWPNEPIQLASGPMRWGSPIPSRDGKRIFTRGVTLRGELVRFDSKTRELQPYLSGISAEFVTFSPDGKSLAYVTFPQGILWKANRDGSNPTQLTDPPLYPTLLNWSPDGRQILFTAANPEGLMKIYVVSSQGGKPQLLLPSDSRFHFNPNWSPDGRRIVFETRETANAWQRSFQILDLSNGQATKVPGSERFWSPRWSPDGRYIDGLTLGTINRDHVFNSLAVFDLKTQKWSVLREGVNDYPVWSHDGKFIYFVRLAQDPGVYRIRPSGGDVERVVDLKDYRYTGVYTFFFGLDPEDTPLLLRDTGIDDIFALTLDRR